MNTWRPSASLTTLAQRASTLARIRRFFDARGVLEVETPVLSVAATPDPALLSLATHYTGPLFPHGKTFYLHTSPEFPMKRLLAAGSGSIYQICRVFRDGEVGRLHNPEFTLLEWYRVGFDHHRLMDEVSELVTDVLADRILLEAAERLTYKEAFERYTGIDPHTATARTCAESASAHGISIPPDLLEHHDVAIWRDLLLSHLVEPRLGEGKLTFIHDFPASQASLARVQPGNPPIAERFELYLNGIELANGFHELADSGEQRARFERQLHARAAAGLPAVPLDDQLLAALTHGLPDCSGVAVGFDRLMMLVVGTDSIQDVIAFPIDRA